MPGARLTIATLQTTVELGWLGPGCLLFWDGSYWCWVQSNYIRYLIVKHWKCQNRSYINKLAASWKKEIMFQIAFIFLIGDRTLKASNPIFSCDSSSLSDNVRRSVCLSVCLSVGWSVINEFKSSIEWLQKFSDMNVMNVMMQWM